MYRDHSSVRAYLSNELAPMAGTYGQPVPATVNMWRRFSKRCVVTNCKSESYIHRSNLAWSGRAIHPGNSGSWVIRPILDTWTPTRTSPAHHTRCHPPDLMDPVEDEDGSSYGRE